MKTYTTLIFVLVGHYGKALWRDFRNCIFYIFWPECSQNSHFYVTVWEYFYIILHYIIQDTLDTQKGILEVHLLKSQAVCIFFAENSYSKYHIQLMNLKIFSRQFTNLVFCSHLANLYIFLLWNGHSSFFTTITSLG